jgi:magnesium-transporting ATPase (P-type)
MVITDDNFATIVDAIAEGRTSYDNIRKTIQFLLGVNFAEIFVLLFGMVLIGRTTITALQILFINVIADGIPGFFLAFEMPEPGVMKRKPLPKGAGVFAQNVGVFIGVRAVTFSIITLAAFAIGAYFVQTPGNSYLSGGAYVCNVSHRPPRECYRNTADYTCCFNISTRLYGEPARDANGYPLRDADDRIIYETYYGETIRKRVTDTAYFVAEDGTMARRGLIHRLRYFGNFGIAITMAFLVLSWASTIDTFNTRTQQSIFKAGFYTNKGVFWAVLILLGVTASVALIGPVGEIFDLVPMSGIHWLISAVLALVQLGAVEILKFFLRQRNAKKAKAEAAAA